MPQPRYYRTSHVHDFFPPGIKWLLIANTLIFLPFSVSPTITNHMITAFALYAEAALTNCYVVQIVTYMFLHGGPSHLVFNMLALCMFGTQLERDWGTRPFLKFYFLC